jgi:hypothetical protein
LFSISLIFRAATSGEICNHVGKEILGWYCLVGRIKSVR